MQTYRFEPWRGSLLLATTFSLLALSCGARPADPDEGDGSDQATTDAGKAKEGTCCPRTDNECSAGLECVVPPGRGSHGIGTNPGDGGHPEWHHAAPPARGAPPDPGPYSCSPVATSRTIGAHRSALPSIVWSGAGYTLAIDEIVSESPFVLELSIEKTDAAGRRIAGPISLTPNDGESRFWPRISFSGWEYGITYLEGSARRAKFMLVDLSFAKIPGADVALGSASGGAASAAPAYSNGQWGVVHGDAAGVWFQRFDTKAQPVAPAKLIAPGAYLSDAGHPMVATPTGWVVVSTGATASLYEIASALGRNDPPLLAKNGPRDEVCLSG